MLICVFQPVRGWSRKFLRDSSFTTTRQHNNQVGQNLLTSPTTQDCLPRRKFKYVAKLHFQVPQKQLTMFVSFLSCATEDWFMYLFLCFILQTVVSNETAKHGRQVYLQANEPSFVKLQSHWRGYLARKAFNERKEFMTRQLPAIIKIQVER